MLSPELEIALSVAFTHATEYQHSYVTCEHMLYALTFDPETSRVLEHCGVKLDVLKADLEGFLERERSQFSLRRRSKPEMTVALQRVLQRATIHVQSSGKDKVKGPDVLVALFSEQESHAVHFLEKQGINRLDVVSYLSHGVTRRSQQEDEKEMGEALSSGEDDGHEGRKSGSALSQYSLNYTQMAKDKRLDPLIGRDKELQRILHILSRRTKNNPLLIGDSGVGKTAIVQGLAQLLLENDVPDFLKGTEIYALDLGGLLAGTKFRGQFEERIKGVLAELKTKPKSLLFIDEIHTIIGAGAVSGGTVDASNILKMPLASGELRCIGATTFEEFKTMEKDKAFLRRFQKVDVGEPTKDDCVSILQGLKSRFEDFHKVTYSQQAVRLSVELSDKYIKDRRLPDKAIDVLDEAGAQARLQSAPHDSHKRKIIGQKEIEQIVAKMAKVPVTTATLKESDKLKTLERNLKLVIFGQDLAVETVVNQVKLSRSGIGNPLKPVGSFLFVGPTGVGKTELAKQLAVQLNIEFLRFDMSEYMEKHTVARLIGAPPGYVGYEKGGLLTDAILRNPHSVLLLDEIEKAHIDLYSILLQVMDHATLTDNEGRKADFRNVVLIMTTNVGAFEMFKKGVGIGVQKEKPDITTGEARKVLERVFTPEFRNRLDAIVDFKALSNDVILNIVDKFLIELQALLDPKKVVMEVTSQARQFLAEKGYDTNFGARPLERLIQKEIKKPLAEELLFGKLSKGGHLKVDVVGDPKEIVLIVSEPTPQKNEPKKASVS